MENLFLREKDITFEYTLRPTNLSLWLAVLLVVGLFVSLFAIPMGYTYDETCPRCQGEGTHTCETCSGSGKCWICEGTGEIWYMPEGSRWCAACQGSGICYTCGGPGWHGCEVCGGSGVLVHWMYTSIGSTIVLSVAEISLFLGLFLLSGFFAYFYLSFNEWVREVNDMGFWFNPSFMTWLFAKHRRRWAKWQTGINSVLAVYLGALLFWVAYLRQITWESLVVGILFSAILVGIFSLLFYKSYTSGLAESP